MCISLLKYTGIAVLFIAAALPLLISHIGGGWTREFTSSAGFAVSAIEGQEGLNVIVTGANTGIGRETARELARAGANVFLTCRSAKKCDAAVEDIKASVKNAAVTAMSLDLGSFKSIDTFAAEFNAKNLPLHTLVLNAGVMKSPGKDA
eukprot:gene26132-31938_t